MQDELKSTIPMPVYHRVRCAHCNSLIITYHDPLPRNFCSITCEGVFSEEAFALGQLTRIAGLDKAKYTNMPLPPQTEQPINSTSAFYGDEVSRFIGGIKK